MKFLSSMTLGAALLFSQQKAHVHGVAALSLAMDGAKGELEIEIPAEGVVGFERAPRTAVEKKAVDDALNSFRTRVNELVVLPAASACKLTLREADVHREGPQHAEFHARYEVSCAKPLAGEVRFGVTKVFPRTREVNVTFVDGDRQQGVRIKADARSLKLN
jgi:hypothetical protein